MVIHSKKYFIPVLLMVIFILSGCSNDLLGLFGSGDFGKRWPAHNTFNFLDSTDRNITLGSDYSFIVLADIHITEESDLRIEKLKNVIDSENIDFVVFCGDITQNGERKQINNFKDAAAYFNVPCYPVIGNHDVYFGNWPVWEELIGSTCYRVDGSGTTLLVLDSANGFFGKDQLDWLENEVKKTSGRLFVFTHTNMFVKSSFEIQQFADNRERARITSILKGKCDIMFMGHLHQRVINELGSTLYLTIEDFRDKAAYCLVWVTPDKVSWEVRNLK